MESTLDEFILNWCEEHGWSNPHKRIDQEWWAISPTRFMPQPVRRSQQWQEQQMDQSLKELRIGLTVLDKFILDWCEEHDWDKPHMINQDWWAIAPSRFMPEPVRRSEQWQEQQMERRYQELLTQYLAPENILKSFNQGVFPLTESLSCVANPKSEFMKAIRLLNTSLQALGANSEAQKILKATQRANQEEEELGLTGIQNIPISFHSPRNFLVGIGIDAGQDITPSHPSTPVPELGLGRIRNTHIGSPRVRKFLLAIDQADERDTMPIPSYTSTPEPELSLRERIKQRDQRNRKAMRDFLSKL